MILAALGAIPSVHEDWPDDAPNLAVTNGRGFIFGILPNNLPLIALHGTTGLWGIGAARRRGQSRRFLGAVTVLYAVLAVAGFLPGLRTVFGVMPLFGANIWIHAVTAIAAGVVLLLWRSDPASDEPAPGERHHSTETSTVEPGVTTAAGRPLHTFLAAFPLAFLASAFATDLAYWWTTMPWYAGDSDFWAYASLWLIGSGICAGIGAAIVGAIDFVRVSRAREVPDGWLYATLSSTALVIAMANLLIRWGETSGRIIPFGLLLSAATAIIFAVAAWHGTSLVYRRSIGPEDPATPHRRLDHPYLERD